MDEAFYVPDGDALVSTELTRGPWDPDAQHAGPPAALLGRAVERCEPRADAQIGRITLEILGPVPLAPLRASARVVRPGRQRGAARGLALGPGRRGDARDGLAAADGRRGARPASRRRTRPRPARTEGSNEPFFPVREEAGYHTAMEIRFVSGGFLEPGPAMVWMRSRVPLVAGEETSPLERLLIAADAGNGVSAALDWRRYLFINTDLSVHLKRLPEGDWVGLDAVTYPEPHGIGLADTALWDERGRLGRAAQTLVVRSR